VADGADDAGQAQHGQDGLGAAGQQILQRKNFRSKNVKMDRGQHFVASD
jgi:hypothetical protein